MQHKPKRMIHLPLCLTVGEVFFSWNSVPLFLQTYLCSLWPSVHRSWNVWWGRRKGFSDGSLMTFRVKQGFWFAFLAILQAVLSKSFLGPPDLSLTSGIPVNWHFWISLRSEDTASWKHFAILLWPPPASIISIFKIILFSECKAWLLIVGIKVWGVRNSIYEALKFAAFGLS